jgi:REP-associated tyrosine transposase
MRIVARVTRQVQVSAGGVCRLGCHVVWCPKYRCPALAGRVAGRCGELNHAKASAHGSPILALDITPDPVRLLVKAHSCGSPSWVASPFKGLTSPRLQSGFPHLRSRLPALGSRLYCAAAAGAVPAQTVCQSVGTQNRRPWRKDRPL